MEEIIILIARYCDGTLDDAGARELARWVTESPANKSFFKAEIKRRGEQEPQTAEAAAFCGSVTRRAAAARRRRLAKPAFATAACFAVATIVVTLLVVRPASPAAPVLDSPAVAQMPDRDAIPAPEADRSVKREDVYRTSSESRTLTLPDGTKVTLNRNSSLALAKDFLASSRTVRLDGEAWFDVAKNPQKPFRVLCGEETFVVTGTTFNICSSDSDRYSIVTLHSGSLEASVADNVIKLSPGDELRIDAVANDIYKHKVEVESTPSWLEDGRLVFHSLPLKYVACQLSRKYGVKIRVNPDICGIVYDGEIREEALPTALRLLAITAPVQLRISDLGGEYYITKL